MEKLKSKKPVVIHNLIKIKTLLFLSMRQQTEKRAATARQISIATEGNPDSLYVLLQRWTKWGLVECIPAMPYMYWIASEGRRYLGKIDGWFFSGYYSRKRKRRVPGYRGKVEDLRREIAIASNAVFWWRHYDNHWDKDREGHKGTVWYMKAPFEKAAHLVKVEGSYGRSVNWNNEDWLLVVKFKDAFHAYRYLPEWGFVKKKEDVGQAIVDAKLGMVWKEEG